MKAANGLERHEKPMRESPGLPPSGKKSYQSLSSEDAEDTILSNLEAQTKRTRTQSDGFRPAIPGERVPLGVESVGSALGDEPHSDPALGKRPSFKQMAKRVQMMNMLRSQRSDRSLTSSITNSANASRASSNGEASAKHRRAATLLARIDEGEKDEEERSTHEAFTDFSKNVFKNEMEPAVHQEGLAYLLGQEDEEQDQELDDEDLQFVLNSPEQQPLLGAANDGTGSERDPATVAMERRRRAQERKNEKRWKRIKELLQPGIIARCLARAFLDGTFVLSMSFFVTSWILFYYVGNPHLDFLPGKATLSWWLNFIGRQLLILELSKLTEFIMIDVLTMSSKFVVQMLGPWITIFCLQSKGWPFVFTFWGLYDMLLLHGNNPFQLHWLYWTGIRIYSQANSGSYILESSVYFRLLIGMVLAGVATTLKRTVLTLYFGKRSFDMYKSKLEGILNDIIVLTEVAELGSEAGALPDDESEKHPDTDQLVEDNLKRSRVGAVRWSDVKFNQKAGRSDSEGSSVMDKMTDASFDASPIVQTRKEDDPPLRTLMARTASPSRSSGLFRIKNLLDRWEEPVNKLDRASESNVNDILKFRKALTYMDLDYPFGEAFGPASTRDELIQSAEILYQRLLKLSPGSYRLPFSVLAVLSENDDGTIDRNMKRSLNNLFRADIDGEIPILTFIQTCDIVYRNLRYFRASVGNTSVIDKVLEGIINGIFGFGLTIVILSLLNFNPWPLLVSVSTLLVSFAFAIGPTVAKGIEGIILIVGVRPFDIGDRIIISNTPGQPTPGMKDSWFVEDITLFSTTLRLGANNEVATVSNGTIAGARITNCARSKNAVVNIIFKLHIDIQKGQNAARFQSGVENYISDNPATWDSLVYCRCEDINTDEEYAVYHLSVRSRHSWQVAARVFADKGKLHQHCIDVAQEMGCKFDSPTSRRVFYYGGSLVDGAVKDYKKNLLMDRNNIASTNFADIFGSRSQLQRSTSAPSGETVPVSMDREAERTNSNTDDMFLAMVQQSQQ